MSEITSKNKIKSKISDALDSTSSEVAASSKAVKIAYDDAQYAISRFEVIPITNLNDLSTKENGWYSISTTILDITGDWIISKFGVIHTATNTSDPRIVLNSVDLTNWYSPYGSWHV